MTEENVHILDPFVGTGTFITRLLQSGLIKKEDMLRKYKNEIHCNEIVLLAYYIADVNIEAVFHDIMHPEKYEMYDGICLTDTFQLNEHGDNDIFSQLFPENSERLQKQKKAPVRVIIGNPPYSAGQKDAHDVAQNLNYPLLDKRIANTYVAKTDASLKKSLYDSYIKAFRWASDRLSQNEDGGIVAFISNGSWIDSNIGSGIRKCFHNEFTSIYVLNLRGNQRTSGEISRKEGGKIFGGGSRTPISITFLVKNPLKSNEDVIHYHDIGDYLTREQKLKMVKDFHSLRNIEWENIIPNEKADWINQRGNEFDSLIKLDSDNKKDKNSKSVFSIYSTGVITNRESWVYNSDKAKLEDNLRLLVKTYNDEKQRYIANGYGKDVSDFVNKDQTLIKWDEALFKRIERGDDLVYDHESIVEAIYRPFFKQYLYFNKDLNWSRYLMPLFFPYKDCGNLSICVNGTGGSKDLTVSICEIIVDRSAIAAGQCFPLYWYEENKNKQRSLFDEESNDDYIRRDGITDWILKEVRTRYGAKNITKEMIFYYVYGLLHSKDYRERFAADLKKSLPRIPIVDSLDDFMEFYKAGKELADLHLNYETVAPYPGVIVHGDRQVPLTVKRDPATGGYIQAPADDGAYDYFRVIDKMRFKSKDDKSVIIYNGNITIENIPQKAYEYIVNGKSAIEWIVERYAVTQDKKSLIKNDANDWAREHHKPRYILDLLLSVINVSVQTVDIVNNLPKLKFD